MGAPITPLEEVLSDAVEPLAATVDQEARFPRPAIDALGEAGLLGLVSDPAVGGLGGNLRDATETVERIAATCGSTAMVVCMHYAAVAAIEAHGPRAIREEIAAGRHLSTLAFSEAGSRSHFWSPVSSAHREGDAVRLDADKSWVTSAGEADSYVWSSVSLAAEGQSTLWLVPADIEGLKVAGPFDGLGLRGNASSPVQARGATISAEDRLGADGDGFAIMMGTVLPWFALMNAAASVGTMEALTSKTIAHIGGARLTHLSRTLADLPTIRAYVARMRIATDAVRTLVSDAVDAVERGRDDAHLRVFEAKASAGESATYVADLALRVCGGAAYRKDVGVERHFRDSRAATVMAPTTDVLYDFIGKAVCGIPLFSEGDEG